MTGTAHTVVSMRRTTFVPLFVVALTVAGCSSGSATKRTVTVVNTVTSSAAVTSKPLSSVIVVSPTATPTPTVSAPKTTPKPTPTTTAPTAAPIVKVDPLKADCAIVLDASDVKSALGATIGANTNRVRLGAAARGVTGAIRCLYGSKDNGKTAPVRMRLTQYNTAAAAKAQFAVDVQAAQDAGAIVTQTTVNGYPATLMIQNGGVIEMAYGTWTLAVAVSKGVASDAALTKGLPVLASQALTRVIKNG